VGHGVHGHVGRGNDIEILKELHWPDSLGLLYSAFTYYTGFKVNSGEYKVMGLAPYGEPKYVDTILDDLIDLKEDGSFTMNQEYFNYLKGLTMTNGASTSSSEAPPEARVEAHPARDGPGPLGPGGVRGDHAPDGPHVHRETGLEEPVPGRRRGPELRGATAGSSGRALREHLDPAGGRRRRGKPRRRPAHLAPAPRQAPHGHPGQGSMKGAYLGPGFSDEETERRLKALGASLREAGPGRAQPPGRGGAGRREDRRLVQRPDGVRPRALGAPEHPGRPRSPKMQEQMNLKIKFRESFRPSPRACSGSG
jgi:carbamoyltransferase